MVILQEIMTYLEELAPKNLAESYDNVGLMLGESSAEISRVLISLDTDEKVAQEAVRVGAQLVISHHPLLFKPAAAITKQTCLGKTIYSLIKNDVNLYAMHTNFDSAAGGLGDYFLKRVCRAEAFDCLEGEFPNGIGRVARLKKELTLQELIKNIKKELGISQIRYVGDEHVGIGTVAVCNGSGADLIYAAYDKGAEVYITGDMKYHHARYAFENSRCLIEVPHYEAEIIFCRFVAELLKKRFGDKCEFIVYHNENPWKIL